MATSGVQVAGKFARWLMSPNSEEGNTDDQADTTGSLDRPHGPPQGDRPAPHARPLQAGPPALRQVLAPLQRHPPRLLQEPYHREDAGPAVRPGPRVRPQGLDRE